MNKKELIEKLESCGMDDNTEVRDLYDGDSFTITEVRAGRPNPEYEDDPEDAPEFIEEDTIFLTVVNE